MRNEVIQRFLNETLEEMAAHIDDNVQRGSVFLPEGDDLRIKAYWGLPPQSVERTICYIGTDARQKSGSAGHVYRTKQQRVVHIRQRDGLWENDDEEHFINFTPNRRSWPYRSFVLTPIFEIGLEESVRYLPLQGVMVFDSNQETTFDHEEVKEYLCSMSKRIASLLRIRQSRLSESRIR